MSIDLDAARAARREANGSAPQVRFGGRDFVLPVEPPWELSQVGLRLEASATARETNAAMLDLLRVLFRDQFDDFLALGPSSTDLTVLIEGDEKLGVQGVVEVYGLGNSRASQRSRKSSKAISRPSKPTSSQATA